MPLYMCPIYSRPGGAVAAAAGTATGISQCICANIYIYIYMRLYMCPVYSRPGGAAAAAAGTAT